MTFITLNKLNYRYTEYHKCQATIRKESPLAKRQLKEMYMISSSKMKPKKFPNNISCCYPSPAQMI